MTTPKHGKPVPIAGRWEHCPKCQQVRAVGAKWLRACRPDKKATRYMGL